MCGGVSVTVSVCVSERDCPQCPRLKLGGGGGACERVYVTVVFVRVSSTLWFDRKIRTPCHQFWACIISCVNELRPTERTETERSLPEKMKM